MNPTQGITLIFAMVSLWLIACLLFAFGQPAGACWVFIASGTLTVPLALTINRDLKQLEASRGQHHG